MRRFDTERAVLRDPGLPVSSVAILLALCTRMAADSGLIPSRHQPSLSRLAADTGLHRRTVMRHLARLEAEGWIVRASPSRALAAATHARTAYTVCPQARGTVPQELGAESPMARGTVPQELGAESHRARGTVPHKSSETTDDSPQHGPEDDLVSVAQAELAALTGRRIDRATGAEAVRQVLDGRRVKRRAQYLRAALRAEPARYMPAASSPPSLAEIQHQLATREGWD